MNKSIFKKGTSALLAMVMCLSTFLGIGSTTAFAAESTTDEVVMISFPRDGDDNLGGNWGHNELHYMNGWTASETNKITVYTVGSWTGNACYCIEPGTPLSTGDNLTKRDETYWDNYPSTYNSTISADEIKLFIGRIFQYGYTGTVTTSWRSQNADDADKMAHIMATQTLIWETVVGERDSNFNHVDTGSYDAVNDRVSTSHPLYSRYISYYNSIAFTFPSVNDRESKVQVVYVDGVFDRGKTRTNKAEAEAVVAEIKRRFEDPQLSKQSVGIVTFNISQQHLIDDLLTEACTQNPDLEAWAFNGDEPLFIKNLENVQGDERDVILFSIGFGPDENGKIYMNFGPLNREGGWRRLNVAVSRARCEMKVFSTMRPDQLDLNRTKAEGVAALRSFLEYAEGRTGALDEAATQKQLSNHAGIADAICDALKMEGYETDLYVGRSEYRIDIGVVDPEYPDQYILGIMLDGPSYGAAKTTRDREIAQVSVLNGLGWNIHRVWCMDWWDNNAKELNRIMEQLRDAQNGKKDITTESTDVIEETNKLMHVAAVENISHSVEQIRVAPMYVPTIVPVRFMSADTFVEPWNKRDIQSKISLVVQTEAPLSLSMLTKRVVQSYGIARAGSRIQAHMNAILKYMNLKSTRQEDTVFYWMSEQDPDAYIGFRTSGEGENHRDVRDVPVQEVANAVCAVLYEQISMGQEDLLRETAKMLGYTRLGGNVLSVLALGIQYAQKCGRIEHSNNGTFVLTKNGMTFAEATVQTFLAEKYSPKGNYVAAGGASTAKAATRKTLTWDEYYSKLHEWSESTMASRISQLTSIGKPEEVFEVIGSLDNEAGALKLVKKALELGLRFSLRQVNEMECYLSAKGAVQLVESLESVDELRNTKAVCDIIEDLEHEEARKALILKVVTSGVKFRLADAIRIVGFIDEESCELMVRNLWEKDYHGGSLQLCEAARELEYDSCCELLIQLAMQKGVRFDPADIVDVDGYIDGDLLGEMVQTSASPLTKSQLEEIQYSLSKAVLQEAARRSQVTLD